MSVLNFVTEFLTLQELTEYGKSLGLTENDVRAFIKETASTSARFQSSGQNTSSKRRQNMSFNEKYLKKRSARFPVTRFGSMGRYSFDDVQGGLSEA